MNKTLSSLQSPTPTLVIGGDLNFPHDVLQWHNIDDTLIPSIANNRGEGDGGGQKVRVQAEKFFNLTSHFNLEQFVDTETHGKEILDLIFTINPEIVHSVSTEYFPQFTDHSLINMTVNFRVQDIPEKGADFVLDSARRLNKLNFSEAPWNRIREELNKIDWSDLIKLSKLSPTVGHSFFLLNVIPVLEALVPKKKSGPKKRSKWTRQRNLVWRKLKKVKDLILQSKSCQKLLRLLKLRDSLETELKSLYLTQNKEEERKVIEEMKHNPNMFFNYAKARQKIKSKVGPLLDPHLGVLTGDPSQVAEILANQYSSVFTVPRADWAIHDMKEFFSVGSSGPTGYILTHLDFTPEDIELACSQLKGSSAAGPDGFPTAVLKECKKELKLPLFHIWRESFKQGIIPPDLLLVQICPIHKGGSRAVPANYRPVALTSHLVKVFERVVRRALIQYLETAGKLPDNQHGFREKRSTLTQLLYHWDQVIDLMEEGLTVDVIYTDFAKAFDKCETNVLLHTLRDCGVRGTMGEWIAAFLDPQNRMQYIGVNGSISSLSPVASGVPQGTVLGPVLFLVHIVDICSGISDGSSSSSFADDTKVWRGVKTVEDCQALQEDLRAVYDAAEQINMIFNSKKFEWLRYSPPNVDAPVAQYTAPDSTVIELSASVKDLGVKLSPDLTFALQVEKVVSTANQVAGWGLRTFRSRSRSLIMQLLKSLVQPHLDYCSQLWTPSAQHLINKIEGVQKALINRISETELKAVNYWDKLKLLKLYSQERRRERYLIIFIWKISQGLVSGYEVPFNYNSRSGRWAVPASMTCSRVPARIRQAKENILRVKGCMLFNLIPAVLRNANHGDILMFKNNLDHFLSTVPDQPTLPGLSRAAETNSLMHQIPMSSGWD